MCPTCAPPPLRAPEQGGDHVEREGTGKVNGLEVMKGGASCQE
jgi:hypothetical protein